MQRFSLLLKVITDVTQWLRLRFRKRLQLRPFPSSSSRWCVTAVISREKIKAMGIWVFINISHNDRALCRCGIRIPSAQNRCPAFDKDKCLEPMFGDVGQARTNAAMLLMTIATTLSRTCTKPTVVRSLLFVVGIVPNQHFINIRNV